MQKEIAILSGITLALMAASRFYKNNQLDRCEANRVKLSRINVFECIYVVSFAVLTTTVYWNRNVNPLPSWYSALRDVSFIQLAVYLVLSKVLKDMREKLREPLTTPRTAGERKNL